MATVLRPLFGTKPREETEVYKVVMDTILEIDGLRMGMSLQKLIRGGSEDDAADVRGVGHVKFGLRTEVGAVKDAIAALEQRIRAVRDSRPDLSPDAIFQAAGIDPAKLLARQDKGGGWIATGAVIDGAIRVVAAQNAGMAEVPVLLIVPEYPDTPPEALFLNLNWTHGQRLTLGERDTAFRRLAEGYRETHRNDRDAKTWSTWLGVRTDIPDGIIYDAVRNVFQDGTDAQKEEAAEALRTKVVPLLQAIEANTMPPDKAAEKINQEINRVAGKQGVTRTAIQKQAKKLGLKLPGKPASHAGTGGGGGSREATALGVKAADIDEFDLRRDAADFKRTVEKLNLTKRFEAIMNALREWATDADRYNVDQSRLVFNTIYPFWQPFLTVISRSRAYTTDAHLARQDRPLVQAVLAQMDAAIGADGGRKARERAEKAKRH